METRDIAVMSIASMGAGVIGGLVGYGTYGHFRDAGWSTWKAGAMTGLINGGVGAILAVIGITVGAAYLPDKGGPVAGLTATQVRGLRGLALKELPRAMGMVTAQKLSGLTVDMLS